MPVPRIRLLWLALLSLLVVDHSKEQKPETAAAPKKLALNAPTMPVRYEQNVGQFGDESIRFVGRKGAVSVGLSDTGAKLAVANKKKESAMVGLTVAGGRKVQPKATEEMVAKTNYLIGSDSSKWHTNVSSFSKVTYPSILDGVDMVYHGANGSLEYDFVVAPGTSVDRIAVNVTGGNTELGADGSLVIHTPAGDIVQPKPFVFQRDGKGKKIAVDASYKLKGNDVSFVVAAYDTKKDLVIDPAIGFATYLGGFGADAANGVAADSSGNTYVTGFTISPTFPTTGNVFQAQNGGCQGECSVGSDAFVAKFSPTGTLLYSTYLGGFRDDAATSIVVDGAGSAIVGGRTLSNNFPVSQAGVFASSEFHEGNFSEDGFVTKLNASGSALAWSTYFGSSVHVQDAVYALALDAQSNVYIAGQYQEQQVKLPPPPPPQQDYAPDSPALSSDGHAFVAALTATGSLLHRPILRLAAQDGSNETFSGIAVDSTGTVHVVGHTNSWEIQNIGTPVKTCPRPEVEVRDGIYARVSGDFTSFTYLTCLAGGTSGITTPFGVATDSSGSAFIAGSTTSSSLTTVSAAQAQRPGGTDAFVMKISGSTVAYATYVGGTGNDAARAITVDNTGSAWITGGTDSDNFPVQAPIQPARSGDGGDDAFVTRLSPNGSQFIFSTYFGGNGDEAGHAIASTAQSIHVAGSTSSNNLPTVNAAQAEASGGQCEGSCTDAFVAVISSTPLLISPPFVQLNTNQPQQFAATGGAGSGYVFSLQTNASGATISTDGAYVAGVVGGATDVVRVTDPTGAFATATVVVGGGSTALVISPTAINLPPSGQQTFTASGGNGNPVFELSVNASGGSVSPTGQYRAGRRGQVTDVVRVTDGSGQTAQATIQVTAGITIAPATPSAPPSGKVSFTATGGSGNGFVWSISRNGSNGTINPQSGAYTAGPGSNVVDQVTVTDALGNTATVNVSVGGGLAVAPSDPTTTTRGRVEFSAFGGGGSFTWSLQTNGSGGTIDAATGVYTAGSTGNVVDVVRVTDQVNNTVTINVTVGPGLTITPTTTATLSGGKVTFRAAGGSGEGYGYRIDPNASGGNVNNNGEYTAGTGVGQDRVILTDSLGNTANATVTVNPVPQPNNPNNPNNPGSNPPGSGNVNPNTIIGGGDDGSSCSCHTVGSPTSNTTPRIMIGLVLGAALLARRRRARR